MNQQYTWQPTTTPNNPASVQYYQGVTPTGRYTISQDQLASFQSTGAFYAGPASVWPEPNTSKFTQNVKYSFHDPVHVAWSSHKTDSSSAKQNRKAFVEENVAAFVTNDPNYGYSSQYATNGAVIR
jgi:hypothetical protein